MLQKVDGIGGGMGVARTKPGVQIQPRLPFESQQWMVALAAGLVRVRALGRAALVTVNRFDRRVQIENEAGGQTRTNDLLMQHLQFHRQPGTRPAQSDEFLVKQAVMRTASAQKTSEKRIVLQPTKMKNPFTAEHPADDEIKQDLMKREDRVVRFAS